MKHRAAIRCWGAAIVLVLGATIPIADAAGELVPFEGLKDQFTISLPDGWSVYDQSQAISGEPSPFGVVFFTAEPLTKPDEKTADAALLARADSGDIATFFVERQPAGKGMTCHEFTRMAAGHVGSMVRSDSVIKSGHEVPTQFLPKHVDLGGCQGFKVIVRAKHDRPVKEEWVVDVRAVSDGKVLYLFSVRATADHYQSVLGTFENVLATIKLSSPH